jgi:archaellum component FlaG (FlaF/FlaG flagellin family)
MRQNQRDSSKNFEWSWQLVFFCAMIICAMIICAILSLVFVMQSMNDRVSALERQVQEVRAIALMPK